MVFVEPAIAFSTTLRNIVGIANTESMARTCYLALTDIRFAKQISVINQVSSTGPGFTSHKQVPSSGANLYSRTGPVFEELKSEGKHPFYANLDETLIPSTQQLNELSGLEEIVMAGYPNGLWDQTNNLPLFRRGVTASHPAVDFQGKSVGVIDAACFPGSSGSPVLILNEGVYTKLKGERSLVSGSRIMLLGTLFAGPQMTVEGEIVVKSIPTSSQPMVVTPVMINLGFYAKSSEILTLAKHISSELKRQGYV